MTPEFKRYQEIEEWVFKGTPEAIRIRIGQATSVERTDIEMAVMTRIAIGDPGLEAVFPEFAHANPENHDWTIPPSVEPTTG